MSTGLLGPEVGTWGGLQTPALPLAGVGPHLRPLQVGGRDDLTCFWTPGQGAELTMLA